MYLYVTRYSLPLLLPWTAIIVGLVVSLTLLNHRDTIKQAENEVRDYHRLNLHYRAWGARLGGVYASSDKVIPNPYLTVPDRDVVTTDGKRLTLINPAYMTRMVFEDIRKSSPDAVISKLTSSNPLNPINFPDEWERKALDAFGRGEIQEFSQRLSIDGKPYLRLISQFVTEKTCLKCHAQQGYKEGDIRGGLSISIPLTAYYARETGMRNKLIAGFTVLWALGSCGILLSARKRLRYEEQLRQQEARFRTVCDWTQGWEYWISPTENIEYVTPACEKITGYSPDDFYTSRILSREIVHPEDRILFDEHLALVVGSSHPSEQLEFRIIRKNGEIRWIHHECRSVTIDGSFMGRRVSNRDITESVEAEKSLITLKDALLKQNEELIINEDSLRRQNNELLVAEEMLRVQIEEYETSQKLLKNSEAKYRTMIDGFTGFIYICSHKYRIEFMNSKLIDRTGRDATGELCYTALHNLNSICPWCVNKRVFSGEIVQWEVNSPKDGRWYSINNSPVYNADDTISKQALIVDITDRMARESEQLKMDKLESLGVLAGGIAHDFNNILTGILGNISLAQMYMDSEHKANKPLAEAEKASARAAELAQQLLTFARGGEPIKKTVSVQHIINEAITFVLHGSNVKGIVDIPDVTHAINADEGQMSQVFHNIFINAAQAMPDGGLLTVTVHNEILTENTSLTLLPGTYVRITCTDQGCGISDENLNKIFEPYFTTKASGNGLGLASVHSIISKHGGHIGVASLPGKGTTFTIYLPSVGEIFSNFQSNLTAKTAAVHAGGTILVMDDEKVIRDLSLEMLEIIGYQAKTCENGTEAVQLYKDAIDSGTPFSAVIMDLTIPGGMGGKETAQQLLAIDPNACLIVSSGYSSDPVMSDLFSYGFAGAMAKPYTISELDELLSSLLLVK